METTVNFLKPKPNRKLQFFCKTEPNESNFLPTVYTPRLIRSSVHNSATAFTIKLFVSTSGDRMGLGHGDAGLTSQKPEWNTAIGF